MSITTIVVVTGFSLTLLGVIVGYLLGWRAGHLTGIEYAMKIWLSGAYIPPANKDMTEYTADVIKDNSKRLLSVKEQTIKEIEELRKSGIK